MTQPPPKHLTVDTDIDEKIKALRDSSEPIRIFVRGLNWVGDAIIATPALTLLRQSYPHAHIALMVRPWVSAVYEHNPDIDELIVHDDAESVKALRKAAKMIKERKYQIGISLPNSFRAALLLQLGGIKHRIGYIKHGRGMLLNHGFKIGPEILKVHQVYYYLNLLKYICGPMPKSPKLVLKAGAVEREEVARLLAERGLDRGQTIFGVAPGSINSEAKRWPASKFAEFIDKLEGKAEVVLLGSGREKAVVQRVEAECKGKVHNLAGEVSLGQVIALTERLHGLVCNDSGAMHIGAAMRIPTVAVFGPTEWNTTYPFSNLATIVRKEGIECAPCMLRECPIDHRCMTRLTSDDVLKAFRQMILDARAVREHREQAGPKASAKLVAQPSKPKNW